MLFWLGRYKRAYKRTRDQKVRGKRPKAVRRAEVRVPGIGVYASVLPSDPKNLLTLPSSILRQPQLLFWFLKAGNAAGIITAAAAALSTAGSVGRRTYAASYG